MAIALVASVKGASTGSSFNTTGAPIDTTGATLLVATLTYFNVDLMAQLTDSFGNTWALLPRRFQTDTAARVFYCPNPIVGTGHTFAVTQNQFGSLVVAAFSGVNKLQPLDVQNGATGTGSTLQTGSVTPTNTNSLVVAALGFRNSGATLSSIDSSFTIIDTDTTSGTLHGSLAYIVETSIVAKNPTWTFSGGVNACTEIAVFIEGTDTPSTAAALVATAQTLGSATFSTSAIDTTGATLIVVNITGFSTIGNLSDSFGNTWIPLTARINVTYEEQLFYAENPTVGAGHIFTVNLGSSGSIQVAAFSGPLTSGVFDKEGGTVGTGGDIDAGAITPANDNSLVISGIAFRNALGQWLLGMDSGFKFNGLLSPAAGPAVGNVIGALGWFVQKTAAAIDPLTFPDGTGEVWAANNAVFKTQSGGAIDIPVPVGALVFATFPPTVVISSPGIIDIPAGALVFATFAPTVIVTPPGTIPIPPGALVLQSFAPQVRLDFRIPIPAGALTITGYAPTVRVAVAIRSTGASAWWFAGPAARMLADAGFLLLVKPVLDERERKKRGEDENS